MPGRDRVRLLHLITRDDRRGAESSALALHEALLRRDWPSRIAALAPASSRGSLDVPVLGRTPLSPVTLARLRKAAGWADVVIAHGSSTLPACALALAGSTPFVYVNIGDPRAWQTSATRRARSRVFLARSRATVALAERSAKALRDLLSVPDARISVIPNFRSSARFHPLSTSERRQVRAGYGVPDDAPLVVYVGSLSPEKRPELAVEAVASLPGVHLLVAGAGTMAAQLRRLAASSLSAGRIHIAGAIGRPEDLHAAADALVLSSDTEGMPGVIIEAGLCGTAAAATSVGFVDEMVVDGTTGRLARPGDASALAAAIREVLASHERYGTAARAFCLEHFEEDVVVGRWENFLTSLQLLSA